MSSPGRRGGAKRLTRLALLTAIALAIFFVELQLPAPMPLPGMKLGLANIVTLYAIFTLGGREALWILINRIVLGAILSGQAMTLFYSLGGGLLCWLGMTIWCRLWKGEQMWLCSPFGGILHNVGQLLVAAWILHSWAVFAYLPYLIISGIVSGLMTGLAAQALVQRLKRTGDCPREQ